MIQRRKVIIGAVGMAAAKLVAECALAIALLIVLTRFDSGRISIRTLLLTAAAVLSVLGASVLADNGSVLATVAYIAAVAVIYRVGGAVTRSEIDAFKQAVSPPLRGVHR